MLGQPRSIKTVKGSGYRERTYLQVPTVSVVRVTESIKRAFLLQEAFPDG